MAGEWAKATSESKTNNRGSAPISSRAGVSAVSGSFGRGDPVEVADETGRVLGQGLTRYDAGDAARIARLRSDQIEAALGYPPRGPLIHRDDLAL